MAEQHEKALVPQIRFTGFTDPWEQRKVQDVADRFDNLRIPVAANLRVHGKTPYYGANGIQDYVDGFTHDGEFVLVAEDGANDLKNYPVKCVNGRIWVNNHAHVLQGKAGIADNSFLAFAISQSDIESLLVGGGRAKLNAETLMSIEFRLPCLQEQHQIGEYLTRLDHLITLHQRKYDKLCVLKKSMLDKMFPKGGSLYPEIRFAGFTDPWEQRKLSSTCEQLSRTINPLETPNEEFTEYSMPAFDNNETAETVIGNSMNSLRKIVDRPCLLVNKLNVRKKRIWHVPRPEANAVCSSEFVPFSSHSSDLSFIKISLLSERITAYLESCSSGSSNSQKRVTPEIIMSSEIIAPSLAEQRRIGAFFDRLDSLITLHQRKLELLRNIKKSMLDKMFV